VSTFITISLEENIDIFKKRTENTKHQHLTKSYNVLTDNIQVDPPFTLLRGFKVFYNRRYFLNFRRYLKN
jgi:hypothetical protein